MAGGRPRTKSPEPDECIKLGKELVAWATTVNKNDPHLTFAQWYSLEKGILRKVWKTLVQTPEFLPYYEKAQVALARRCINGEMEKSFGHRYIRLYDRELVECEDATKRFEAELRRMNPETLSETLTNLSELHKWNEKRKENKDKEDECQT